MSSRPLKGIPRNEVAKIMREGVPEKDITGNGSEPINARCSKCGGDLRATAWLLKFIRQGVVDHAECGGTWRALSSPLDDNGVSAT